jgi:glyoxylate carboligase
MQAKFLPSTVPHAVRETAVPTVTVVEVENEASPPSEAAVTVMVPELVPRTLTNPMLLTKSDFVIRAVEVADKVPDVKFPLDKEALTT